MAEVLIVSWDGGGNVPPALGIADELVGRGHKVCVLGHAGQVGDVTERGHEFVSYQEGAPFVGAEPSSPLRMARLFSDRGMGRDLVAVVSTRQPDVVIIDALLVGAQDEARRAGIPYVSLQHLFDSYQRGGWLHGPMGWWAQARGIRPGRCWEQASLVLAATLPELDTGSASAARDRVIIGPVVARPRNTATFEQDAVLVSLSTFAYPGMAKALQKLIDATDGLDARIVVTTGPVLDPSDFRVHSRVEMHRYVSHDDLMPEMSLVVGHGGHATTMRALGHDLPMLLVPMHSMVDQPTVAKAVESAGAGLALKRSATVEQLRAAMTALLADGPHRRAAAGLGERIRGMNGAQAGADALQPLLRGTPATP